MAITSLAIALMFSLTSLVFQELLTMQQTTPAKAAERMEYTVESTKSFDEAVSAVKKAAEEQKFTILAVHEISKTLESKGFPREPLTIVEVCNAKQASIVLKDDIRVALMLPCPISIHVKDGKTYVSTIKASILGAMYEGPNIPQVATEVEMALRKMVDSAK